MINKRLLKESRVDGKYITAVFLASLINSFFIIFNAGLLSLIVNTVFVGRNFKNIKTYIVLFVVNAALKAILNFLMENNIKSYSQNIKEKIRQKTFKNMIFSNSYKLKEETIGKLINLFTDGIEMLVPYFSEYIPQFLNSIVIPLVILINILIIDKLSAALMLITYPIIPIFMILIGYKSKEINKMQWKKLNILSSHFIDMLQGIRTLKAFGRSKLQVEKVYEVSEEYRKSTIEVLKVSFLSALVLETASTISIAVLAVNLGLRLVYNKISFLTAFFILVLSPEFYLPLRQLGAKFHASLNGQVVIEEIESLEKNFKNDNTKNENISIDKGNFEIELRNLYFSHEQRETLDNISFKIENKQKVALIGESGSGKSTIINIISGLLNAPNKMVFINGVDINDISLKKYIERVALVPQFPYIFNMSIEENIILNNKSIGREKLENIYKVTKLDSFVHQFKHGYNTILGDGESVQVSGGEKQRIALARALVKPADIIILDEPSSALDPETEEIIPDIMNNYLKNKTVLIAAHRLNTITNADKIIVLSEGRVVEEGTHDELIRNKGRYYEMIKDGERWL